MTEIEIREFEWSHAGELLALWRESFEWGVGLQDPHPLAEQEQYLRTVVAPNNAIRVAFQGERMAGFVAASPATIAQLYVRKDLCRRGVGSALLAWAKTQSGGALRLFTFEQNAVARAFYERHGFTIVARGYEPTWKLNDLQYAWHAAGRLRLALDADIPALRELVTRSAAVLSAPFYTPEQTAAIALSVYGVDSELIADGTFFLVEGDRGPVACGGWGKRRVNFGGDQAKAGPGPLLDPRTEPARIRAFFVDPAVARRGLGRLLLDKSIAEAKANGFSRVELVASLSGEPLYLSAGFQLNERFDLALPGDIKVPVARMGRAT